MYSPALASQPHLPERTGHAAPASGRGLGRGNPGSVVDEGDRLDLDHEIGAGEAADLDRRAGRRGGSEIAHAHLAVLGELLEIGHVGVGLDDVGEGGAGRLETGLDVLADLLDLGAHVPLADAIALWVAAQLPGDKDLPPGATERHDLAVGRLAGHNPDMHALRLDLFAVDRHCVSFPYNAVLDDTPRARP